MKAHEWFWSVLLGVVVVGVLIYCQYAKSEIERIGQDISDMRTVVEALKEEKPRTVIIEREVQVQPALAKEERTSIGTFICTAYCSCKKCCGKWSNPEKPLTASGEIATEGVTVGADWDMFPSGTVIEIEGLGDRTVQDKPAGWIVDKYDGRILDVYFDDHDSALKFGKQELEVWVK